MKGGFNLNILILGGDNRYLQVVQSLTSNKIHVFLSGFDQLDFADPMVHHMKPSNIDYSKMDAILLPVSGTDLDGNIETSYSTKSLKITEAELNITPEHCTIYTGISNDYLNQIAQKTNRKIVPLFARNDIAIYNSIPTAEATLKIAIEETEVTIHGSKILVLGFGRVGITVARSFHHLGANVTVAARRPEHFARMHEMGLKAIETQHIGEIIPEMNIIINTIPQIILDSEKIDQMSSEVLIIDLASKPGGTDFDYASKKGIKAIHALGLPGKTAPKTAGEIIGKVLLELILD